MLMKSDEQRKAIFANMQNRFSCGSCTGVFSKEIDEGKEYIIKERIGGRLQKDFAGRLPDYISASVDWTEVVDPTLTYAQNKKKAEKDFGTFLDAKYSDGPVKKEGMSKEVLDEMERVWNGDWSIEGFERLAHYADDKRKDEGLSEEIRNQWAHIALTSALEVRGMKREAKKYHKKKKKDVMDKTQREEMTGEVYPINRSDPDWDMSEEDMKFLVESEDERYSMTPEEELRKQKVELKKAKMDAKKADLMYETVKAMTDEYSNKETMDMDERANKMVDAVTDVLNKKLKGGMIK